MPKYEIVVEEMKILEHRIIVDCEENQLNNLPDPITFNDILEYTFNKLSDFVNIISVHEETQASNNNLTKISNIIPIEEE